MIYAIGDIHGRSDLLDLLLTEIENHAAGRPARVIFLGDFIDRGPDSAGVVRMVRQFASDRAGLVHCLMGNHEQMLLLAMEDPAARACWLDNGGTTTLESFKVADAGELPSDVIRWIRRLPTSYEDAKRYFVHAGLDPASPLADQTDADRLWIREPFISADHDFGKHVVHGHTPVRSVVGTAPMPDEREHRTNIDTGAVFGGALTAAVFEDRHAHPVGFLQVQQDGFTQFLSSRRQVLELMTRLSGNAQKPVVATAHVPSRRIAASVLILGLAGTGIALASMNWSGTDKLAAARPTAIAANDKIKPPATVENANSPAAAPKPPERRAVVPDAASLVPAPSAGAERPARADAPSFVPPAVRSGQQDMAGISPRQSQSDAVPPAVIAGTPLAPTLPRIAQDQVATRPGPVREETSVAETAPNLPRVAEDQVATRPEPGPEATIAREATPSLPSVAQDQVATRPAQAPGTDQATAELASRPTPQTDSDLPTIAQDQPSARPQISPNTPEPETSVAANTAPVAGEAPDTAPLASEVAMADPSVAEPPPEPTRQQPAGISAQPAPELGSKAELPPAFGRD